MKTKIILDCDDVLYPCNQRALELLNEEKGTKFTLNHIFKWGIMGTDLDERLKYFKDPSFIRELHPYEGARGFIRALSRMGEIFVATSVAPMCAGERVTSILKYFPEISPENILIGSRKDMLHGDILLDDGMHNIIDSKVDYPVLFRQPWNQRESGALAVSNYDEFLSFVQMIQRKETEIHPGATVFVLVGPSGSGKTDILNDLVEEEGFEAVRTYTTAVSKAHAGNYCFLKSIQFEKMKQDGAFFETSSYAGYQYGLAKKSIDQIIDQGKKAVLMLDINGAIALKRVYGSACVTAFVSRPKRDCIKSVLDRKLDFEETLDRIESLDSEFKNKEFCDLMINGSNVEAAVEKIKEVQEYGRF